MQYTTNYSLKKPDASDLVSISDLNANADAIDAQLKIIEGEKLSDTEKKLIVDILRNAVYKENQAENINSLAAHFGIGSTESGGTESGGTKLAIESIVQGSASYASDFYINPLQTRSTMMPIGQYLTKGRTYKFSIGEAASKYQYGVQIFTVKEAGLTFDYDGKTETHFEGVTARIEDTGWFVSDYAYKCTEDNCIIAINFRLISGEFMSTTDYTYLQGVISIEEE